MPGRFWCLLIVVCWLSACAWFVLRDVWPRLAPEEPPRFAIDLVDETRPVDTLRRTVREVFWVVIHRPARGPEVRYSLLSSTAYHPEDDTFTLQARLAPGGSGDLKRWDSRYRVSRDGAVLAWQGEVSLVPGEPSLERHGEFGYVPDGRRLVLDRNLFSPATNWERSRVEPERPLPHSGLVQIPLHPVYRLERPALGRSWKVPFFDPIQTTRSGQTEVSLLEGSVRSGTERLDSRGKEWRCLVLQFHGEKVNGEIWLDADDGQVLRMSWDVDGDRWTITQGRDVPGRREDQP